ncbi:endocuticle structural glycoprotein SgAbd-5-like [Trichoplusia ni]|uniref:Endocuticle structural glycoprotein SgAbd-5-like n=1 Tax=Trichoplusia ni TaxID=7111 RepID=A0A7E5VNP1_TRINI|nr:endocuticle structural glycoprotein SgAbd-5-like [Trichoplusia ni]
MKLFVVLCLVSVAVAGPASRAYSPNDVEILQYDNDNIGLGNYKYSYQQSDGTGQSQEGKLINEGQENESLAVTGSYTWVGPDGVTYRITYKADENGYQPEIEQGPGGGIPPALVASLLG